MIDWSRSSRDILRMIRSYDKEGCIGDIAGSSYLIREALPLSGVSIPAAEPGSELVSTEWEKVVRTGDGAICIRYWSKL